MNNDVLKNGKFIKVLILSVALIAAGIFLYFSKILQLESSTSKSVDSYKLEVQTPKADLAAEPPSEAQFKQSGEIKILFLGDMMFDRYIWQVAEKKGFDFIFGDTDNILRNNDLVVGNLEGPITDHLSVSVNSEFETRENYIFTFKPQVAEELKKHNINLVNLGNNHILNFGQNGLEQTKNYLKKSGVEYFCTEEKRIVNYELSGLKISIVCFNQFESEAQEKALSDIAEAKKKSNVVILYAHWGKEYESQPLEKIKILARNFINSGADLIIGSHPHVVQSKEIYHDKMIYYSLGNFIFDQYFDPRTAEGLAVKATIRNEKYIEIQEFKLNLKKNGQTVLKSAP